MTIHPDRTLNTLRQYVGEHGAVPSLSTLARIWGYGSKTSAFNVVAKLVNQDVLVRAADGRLVPGPCFFAAPAENADRHDRIADEWRQRWHKEGLAEAYDLVTRITQLAQAITESVREAAAANKLTVGELLVLDVLHRMGPPFRCAPTELKHHFALSLPGVGKRVASLQRKGLIERVPSAKDKRSLLVQLSDAGLERLEESAQIEVNAPHIRWAMRLGPAARSSLVIAVRHALTEIEKPRGTSPPSKIKN